LEWYAFKHEGRPLSYVAKPSRSGNDALV